MDILRPLDFEKELIAFTEINRKFPRVAFLSVKGVFQASQWAKTATKFEDTVPVTGWILPDSSVCHYRVDYDLEDDGVRLK